MMDSGRDDAGDDVQDIELVGGRGVDQGDEQVGGQGSELDGVEGGEQGSELGIVGGEQGSELGGEQGGEQGVEHHDEHDCGDVQESYQTLIPGISDLKAVDSP